MAANVMDAKGLTFECQPGCGFCCTASPLVGTHESAALPLAVRTADGTLRIPLQGAACSKLGADRRCTVYEVRPSVCHLYPYQVHAGRRIQVAVSLACPGISDAGAGEPMDAGAERAAALALAQPGAAQSAADAKATYAEFDRRMKEWNVAAPPDKLRAGFLPHVATLALPAALPPLFAAIAEPDLLLEGDAARAVADLFAVEADATPADLFDEGARDAFDEPDTIAWVEPASLAWTSARLHGGKVELTRAGPDGRSTRAFAVRDLPLDATEEASALVARYLARLLQRDHTEGAAMWLVDASRYHATPAAAYARVLGEASLQVNLRAAMFAAEEGAAEIGPAHARRGVMAYETAFHSLPTLGAIL